MNAAQFHRGPDEAGVYCEPSWSLRMAMRRLAIVDINEGHQPMASADGSRVVVFNGEIFNAKALRLELEALGHHFRTHHSDTEVLLHAHAAWGEAMLDRLNGMFAFVLYDKAAASLFGARDHTGIKPLYYWHADKRFAFASELKSLRQIRGLPQDIDNESLWHYLTLQFVPAPRTILRGVRKLAAGEAFRLDLRTNSLQVFRYWTPKLATRQVTRSAELIEELRPLLRQAVNDWLMSDVPVGCSLSGGIDSVSVVSIMASLGSSPLRTWTLGFAESLPAVDERDLARLVAERFGAEHHEVVISAKQVLGDLESMVQHLDEPYGGGLPAWYVFRGMHGQVKVAMTGTGGDELFGNYHKWHAHVPGSYAWKQRMRRSLRTQGPFTVARARHGALYHGYAGEREKRRWIRAEHRPVIDTATLIEKQWKRSGANDPKACVAFVDFAMQLPDEFLHMTDRFSMAWSIEARTPLLDRRLVEAILALPSDVRVDSRTYKGLMKEVVAPWVPKELLDAPKRGFVLPMREWTRNELRDTIEDVLGEHAIQRQGIFEPALYRELVGPHLRGEIDATDQVWTLMMFQLWWRDFSKPTSVA